MERLKPSVVADWLMNEQGLGASDEEFLETFQLMEAKIENNLSDDYTFINWLQDVLEEIEELKKSNKEGLNMRINEMRNLWVAYNRTEDFRVLVCAEDETEAQAIANEYGVDAKLEGEFCIEAYNSTDFRFDCDYVLMKN